MSSLIINVFRILRRNSRRSGTIHGREKLPELDMSDSQRGDATGRLLEAQGEGGWLYFSYLNIIFRTE